MKEKEQSDFAFRPLRRVFPLPFCVRFGGRLLFLGLHREESVQTALLLTIQEFSELFSAFPDTLFAGWTLAEARKCGE